MSQKDYDMNPRWYVVHTYSGYENKVKTDLEKTIKNRELEEYFFDIIVPMEEQIEIKDGKKKTNLKKVFPGYVLIKMIVTEETWYIVRNTRGVTGFVGSGTDPIPLTDEEIRSIGFEDINSINVDYEVNDQVQIMNGAFENFTGTVQEINKEKNKVKGSIPTLLNQLMNVIPNDVQIKSIQNTNTSHVEITVESPKYEQIAFLIGSIKTEVILTNVISTSGQKNNDVITVKIEGDLP